MKKKPFILFLNLIFISGILLGQPIIQVRNYSLEEGLSHTKVESIIQDRKGFIWISTWNGLNRFDGYEFKTYNSNTVRNKVLTDNRINNITENNFGNIWCRTYSRKLYLFDVANEEFIDIIGQSPEETGPPSYVSDVYCLANGITLIVFENGKLLKIKEDKQIEKYSQEYIPDSSINISSIKNLRIRLDSDGDIWIFSSTGISILGKKTIHTKIPYNWCVEKDQ